MAEARIVVVTGGNRGIGRSIADQFLASGHRVAVLSRSSGGPEGALRIQADMTDEQSIDKAISTVEAEFGKPEIVVANAGITRDRLLMQMTMRDFDEVLDTNLRGTFSLVRRTARGMLGGRFGRIILISSVVALSGSAGQTNYAASKAALIGLARSLTKELAGRGITSNVVAPGYVETDMTAVLGESIKARYRQSIPVGRFAHPDEIAHAVAWLASDDASYISGAVIPVDGGLGMGH